MTPTKISCEYATRGENSPNYNPQFPNSEYCTNCEYCYCCNDHSECAAEYKERMDYVGVEL